MRGKTLTMLGVLAFFVAGFVRGGLRNSADPELVYAFSWSLGAFGAFAIVAGGIAVGLQLARE